MRASVFVAREEERSAPGGEHEATRGQLRHLRGEEETETCVVEASCLSLGERTGDVRPDRLLESHLCVRNVVEASEALGLLLKDKRIPFQILNARYHEQEAEIIA